MNGKNYVYASNQACQKYVFTDIVHIIVVMRLGKKKEKEKDMDSKNQVIDSVLRLICSSKTQHYPLTSKLSATQVFIQLIQ